MAASQGPADTGADGGGATAGLLQGEDRVYAADFGVPFAVRRRSSRVHAATGGRR